MRGFSLVELMVTIGLFSLLCLAVFPNILRFAENGNLRAATRDITTDITTMKETAMTRGANCQITFNTGVNNFILTTPDGTNTVKTPTAFSRDIVITNAAFAGGGPTMTFQPRGTATNGTVTLQNNRGSVATITVNITGRTYAQFNMQ